MASLDPEWQNLLALFLRLEHAALLPRLRRTESRKVK
jgi:hypothetical protein